MDLKKCAYCGKDTLPKESIFRICPVCGWQDDEVQNRDPDYSGGANHMSLNEAKKAFSEGKPLDELHRKGWEDFLKKENSR